MFENGQRIPAIMGPAPIELNLTNVPGMQTCHIKIEYDEQDGLCFLTPWGMRTIKKDDLQEGEVVA